MNCPLCELPTDLPHGNESVCLMHMTADRDRLRNNGAVHREAFLQAQRRVLELEARLALLGEVNEKMASAIRDAMPYVPEHIPRTILGQGIALYRAAQQHPDIDLAALDAASRNVPRGSSS